jgi:intein/homing endonuclease
MNRQGVIIVDRRIKFYKGRQREFIKMIKSCSNMTWAELSKFLNISERTLRIDWLGEKCTLPEEKFKKMLSLVDEKRVKKQIIEKYIKEILPANWGRKLGGKISIEKIRKRNVIKLIDDIENSKDFSEIVGIILGDGSISEKVVEITLEYPSELDYSNYISKKFKRVFNLMPNIKIDKKNSAIRLRVYSKDLVRFLTSKGLKIGNKIANGIGIPSFIKKDKKLLKFCLRGLIDTDGGFFQKEKNGKRVIIEFKNENEKLLKDVKEALEKLGFTTSKSRKGIRVQKQEDVIDYINKIGTKNYKNVLRLKKFGIKLCASHLAW